MLNPNLDIDALAREYALDERLRIENAAGKEIYESGLLGDPLHVPDRVLPAGNDEWFVDALDERGKVLGTREPQNFSIAENALELPWVEPEELLSRVPVKQEPGSISANRLRDDTSSRFRPRFR